MNSVTLPVLLDPRRTRMAQAVLAFLALVAPAEAQTRGLFRIERSTNRNVVEYDLRLSRDGAPDPKDPVSVYWIMLEEGGRREGLTFFERQFAYGVDVSAGRDGLVLHVAALRDRPIHVRRRGERWEAQTMIAGHLATLRRIWVQADGGVLGPGVKFVEVTGLDVESGRVRTERIASH
ncbi:MAG TPA: DUF4833 domain-containing protein [Polyangiaceae bacterium]|nr:DUF4833 domain-containing protein [Polyangiaceae bacterium]